MFVAGYETIGHTLGFTLYEIARDQRVQDRLAAELLSAFGPPSADNDVASHITNDELEKCTYLVAVVKEALRLHPTVQYGLFESGVDDLIPLSEKIVAKDGREYDRIPVKRCQQIVGLHPHFHSAVDSHRCQMLSFGGFNRSPLVWGPDSEEFKPERWLERSSSFSVPIEKRGGGPYENLANFGGGPKSCIGWRFAVLELQAFIAVLLSQYHLELPEEYEMWRSGCFIGTVSRIFSPMTI
jgi:cytochrome P450